MKRVFKNPIIMFILGALTFGGMGTIFAYSIISSNVGFTPKDTSWNVDNAEDALNYLYNNSLKFEVDNKYFASYYGTESATKTISKKVPKGKYIVSSSDSIGTTWSSSNFSKESDAITLQCDKNCKITKIDEHNTLASGKGYCDSYHAIYKVDVIQNDTTITQKTAWTENNNTNRQTMSMQIVKLK